MTLLLYLLATVVSQLSNVTFALNSLRAGLGLPIPDIVSTPAQAQDINIWEVISELTLPVVLVLGDFLVVWRAWVISYHPDGPQYRSVYYLFH